MPILHEAENAARDGADVSLVLSVLRKLSLDEFGLLMISLPNPDFPALSAALPPMASERVQNDWTGGSGVALLKLTSAFARQVENNFTRYTGRPLSNSTIMDFGCGYGRILRMMYYYSDPSRIWGVDAWARSLQLCTEARLPGHFVQSDLLPQRLPVGDTRFDLAFAFSVFTHLSPKAANACLNALRHHVSPDGLLVVTIRPKEYWPFTTRRAASKSANK